MMRIILKIMRSRPQGWEINRAPERAIHVFDTQQLDGGFDVRWTNITPCVLWLYSFANPEMITSLLKVPRRKQKKGEQYL